MDLHDLVVGGKEEGAANGRSGRIAGRVTSGGYGYSVQRSLA
jgi:glycine cleavage system aminomethyltransferase T